MKEIRYRATSEKTRLLIVDDSKIIRDRLTRICAQMPHLQIIEPACDGLEAITAIRAHKPDVVILDIRMPNMSGIEVLHAMKKESLKSNVIILSSAADAVYREKCLELGARHVFHKITEFEKLVQILGTSVPPGS